jgi:hypothetical protein
MALELDTIDGTHGWIGQKGEQIAFHLECEQHAKECV